MIWNIHFLILLMAFIAITKSTEIKKCCQDGQVLMNTTISVYNEAKSIHYCIEKSQSKEAYKSSNTNKPINSLGKEFENERYAYENVTILSNGSVQVLDNDVMHVCNDYCFAYYNSIEFNKVFIHQCYQSDRGM